MMETQTEFTAVDIRSSLTPQNVRMIQVIQGAIGMGLLLFGAVVAFVIFAVPHPLVPGTEELATALTYANIVFLAGALAGWKIVGTVLTSPRRFVDAIARAGSGNAERANACLNILRASRIVRLAILEAPSFFGIVVVMTAGLNGVIAAEPAYALNAFGAVGTLFYIAATFPTAENLEAEFNAAWSSSSAGMSRS